MGTEPHPVPLFAHIRGHPRKGNGPLDVAGQTLLEALGLRRETWPTP
jgi:hypothetical protein